MQTIEKASKYLSTGIAYIAYAALTVMMVFVGVAALARAMHHPIIGDVEIVQLCMVVLVATSFAYTEHKNGHVEVGILVDNFPGKIQRILDIFSQVLVVVFCAICAYAFVINFETEQSSILLGYKYFPLKILLIVGLIAWALVAIQKIIVLIRMKEYKKFEE